MKTVYFARHGESAANVGGVVRGGAHTELTENGRKQAAILAGRLSHLPIEVIVASTYLRATQTADIIAEKTGKPVVETSLFAEWNQGSHRIGKLAHDPQLFEQSKDLVEHIHEENRRIADEENFTDLNARAADALAYLAARNEERIAVVGHGWFTPVLFGKAMMGTDFTGRDCQHFMQRLLLQNTSISVLAHDETRWWGPWQIVTWNDHAHLS